MILDKNISLPSHVMFQEFDDESVLLDIRTQEHFGLDNIANEFVKSIYNGSSPREAYTSMLQVYEVSQEQLEKDLETLLEKLLEHKLIEVI